LRPKIGGAGEVSYNADSVSDRILIIGGVAAGLSAASAARRASASAQIVVLERGPVSSYGACGLPAFLSGRVRRLDDLVVYTPEFFRERRHIEVLTGHEALEVLGGRRRVRTRSAKGEKLFDYDRLVICTGAVGRAGIAGLETAGVFEANTWTGAQALDAALRGARGRLHAGVIGGGYIGLEVADALLSRGLEVSIFERGPTILNGVDGDISALLEEAVVERGARLFKSTEVREIAADEAGHLRGVETTAGTADLDLVVMCAGLKPDSGLAAAAGAAVGDTGAIAVDDRQQTSLAGIFAAGDCAETRHVVTGKPTWIALGTAANKQGRVAGHNAAGAPATRFIGVLGTLAVRIFGRDAGRTGLSSAEAEAAGYRVAGELVEAATQPGYMGQERVTIKIIYRLDDLRLVGCQLLGREGAVAGRLNVAATAITGGMTLPEIEQLDLAYSPALAPLYEPLLIAAHNALRRR
jgi:NADPH-dependent 2,4-dienoyl-CoA reductase/sulfur reductase-like enzyme